MRETIFLLLMLISSVVNAQVQDTLFLQGTCDSLIKYEFDIDTAEVTEVTFELGEGTFVIDFEAHDAVDTLVVIVDDVELFRYAVGTRTGTKNAFHWIHGEGVVDEDYYPNNPFTELNRNEGFGRFTFTTENNCGMKVRAISHTEDNTYWAMWIHCCDGCEPPEHEYLMRDTMFCVGDYFLDTQLVSDTMLIDTFTKSNGCKIFTQYWTEVNADESFESAVTCNPDLHDVIVFDTIANVFGCDSVVSRLFQYPQSLADLQIDQVPECDMKTFITASTSLASYESSLTFEWNTGESSGTIFVDQERDYSVTITHDSGCTIVKEITAQVSNSPTLDLGPDIEISEGLQVIIASPSTKQELQDRIVFQPTLDYDHWFPTQDQLVIARLINDDGCVAIDSIFVKVLDRIPIYIPNAFSPNGDGVNDFWEIYTSADIQSYEYEIFDRWGEQLFRNNKQSPDKYFQAWDGVFRKETMQQNVVVYWIEIIYTDGYVDYIKGDITIFP